MTKGVKEAKSVKKPIKEKKPLVSINFQLSERMRAALKKKSLSENKSTKEVLQELVSNYIKS